MKRSLGEELAERFSKEVQAGKLLVSKNINSKGPLKRRAARGIDYLSIKILRAHQMGASPSELRFLQKNLQEILFAIGSKASESKTRGKFVVSDALLKSISNANSIAQNELGRFFQRKLNEKIKGRVKKRRRK